MALSMYGVYGLKIVLNLDIHSAKANNKYIFIFVFHNSIICVDLTTVCWCESVNKDDTVSVAHVPPVAPATIICSGLLSTMFMS